MSVEAKIVEEALSLSELNSARVSPEIDEINSFHPAYGYILSAYIGAI